MKRILLFVVLMLAACTTNTESPSEVNACRTGCMQAIGPLPFDEYQNTTVPCFKHCTMKYWPEEVERMERQGVLKYYLEEEEK